MKTNILTIASLMLLSSVYAQEKSKFQLQSVTVQTGFFTESSASQDINYFERLAPESEILKELKNKDDDYGESYYHNGNSMFSAFLTFGKSNGKERRFDVSYRIGLTALSSNPLSLSFSQTDEVRIDTAFSTSTGTTYFIDSISDESYYLNYTQSQILLDLAILVQTPDTARWKLYGGFSIAGGISFNNRSNFNKISRNYLTNVNSVINEEEFENEYEDFKQEESMTFVASIPLGVKFQLGRKGKFLTNSSLNLEIRPSIITYSVPELDLNISSFATFNSLGFEYRF